jgi:hypothetical protein
MLQQYVDVKRHVMHCYLNERVAWKSQVEQKVVSYL